MLFCQNIELSFISTCSKQWRPQLVHRVLATFKMVFHFPMPVIYVYLQVLCKTWPYELSL